MRLIPFAHFIVKTKKLIQKPSVVFIWTLPFQMVQTSCTLLLSIFISTSLHVSGNYVPIIRRTYCIYATLVCFTLYGWLFSLGTMYGWLSGLQTRQPPIQSEKYQCRIDTVSSPDDGHIVTRNM